MFYSWRSYYKKRVGKEGSLKVRVEMLEDQVAQAREDMIASDVKMGQVRDQMKEKDRAIDDLKKELQSLRQENKKKLEEMEQRWGQRLSMLSVRLPRPRSIVPPLNDRE